jgi:hypothetical protein
MSLAKLISGSRFLPRRQGLTFWFNCSSSESATTAYDFLYVEVRNTSGTLLQTLATYSNKDKTTAGSYSQKRLAWRPTRVRLSACNSATQRITQ